MAEGEGTPPDRNREVLPFFHGSLLTPSVIFRMREHFTDIQPLAVVMDGCDRSIGVAFDIEHGVHPHRVRAVECLPDVRQIPPIYLEMTNASP